MEEEIKIRATRAQIEKAKNSFFWKDMVRELEGWKEGFEKEPLSIVANAKDENPSTAAVLMHLGDIAGRIKAIDYILEMPDVFLSMLDMEVKKDG